mgnify:CR=1 FL=1
MLSMYLLKVHVKGMMASEDFSGGIKELLLEEVPNVRDVVLVG